MDAEDLRQALLQRLADDLAACVVIEQRDEDLWRCCWLVCPGSMVHLMCRPGCQHWHHRSEVFT